MLLKQGPPQPALWIHPESPQEIHSGLLPVPNEKIKFETVTLVPLKTGLPN